MADKFASVVLGERFRRLWARCLSPDTHMDATPVYEDLVERYAEPGRQYHGWAHLAHCLQEFDRAAGLMGNSEAVELALWFHDAVYVPGAEDNERQSAELFRRQADPWFSAVFVEKVCELILITIHRQCPNTGDESYVADIDLSSLAVEWSEFLRDGRNIRKEHAQVSDSEYYPAHAGFLQMLLNRPRIFNTDFFHERYEESARQNIRQLLASTEYAGENIGKV